MTDSQHPYYKLKTLLENCIGELINKSTIDLRSRIEEYGLSMNSQEQEKLIEYYSVLNPLLQHELPIYYGFTALSFEAALQSHRELKAFPFEAINDNLVNEVQPLETVHPLFYDPAWLPIAHDYNGSYLALDYHPASKGVSGQIISFGVREPERYALFYSLENFISTLLIQVETGKASLQCHDRNPVISLAGYEDSHLLDAIRERGLKVFQI